MFKPHSLNTSSYITPLLASFLLVFLSACQSSNVIVDYDTSTDFSTFSHYQLIDDNNQSSDNQPSDNIDPLMRERVLQALNSELIKQGFILANKKTPENFLVRYVVTTTTRTQEPNSGASIGLGGGGTRGGIGISLSFPLGGDTTIKETQIIIDLLSPQDQALKWRSSKTLVISNESPEQITTLINAALAEIFSFFPPKANN